ncbi:MAG: hypothetical protein FWB76_05130 [Oscillospiraceae bacterium]|nr:hypothetical protein [Oscillospiraceae bacterium]
MSEIMFAVIVISAETLRIMFVMLLGRQKELNAGEMILITFLFSLSVGCIVVAGLFYGGVLLQNLPSAIVLTIASVFCGIMMHGVSYERRKHNGN